MADHINQFLSSLSFIDVVYSNILILTFEQFVLLDRAVRITTQQLDNLQQEFLACGIDIVLLRSVLTAASNFLTQQLYLWYRQISDQRLFILFDYSGNCYNTIFTKHHPTQPIHVKKE